MTSYSAIVALTLENGMGMNGKIPWRVPEDFKYFKSFTMGKTCVMGRKTYEDILTYAKDKDNPLPGRQLVVLSTTYTEIDDPSWGARPIVPKIVRRINGMHQLSGTAGPICFIGGAAIYKEAADRFSNIILSVTRLHFPTVVECDTFFVPEESGFKRIHRFFLGETPHVIETYMNWR
jgi:dihydrofolate reductase